MMGLAVIDAEAVRLSATDNCWRFELGTLEDEGDKPAFSQGGLQQFRERMIRHDMDRQLLERTIEVAKQSRAFDWRKVPKSLRVAVDSRPLTGAGRVEDTINLLGHAGRKIAECMAAELETTFAEICRQANAPLLLASSIKAGLDIDWNDADAKEKALCRLCVQLDRLSSVGGEAASESGRGDTAGSVHRSTRAGEEPRRGGLASVVCRHVATGIRARQVVEFDPEICGPCPLRAQCTQAASGRGRTVTMGDDERLQKRLKRRRHKGKDTKQTEFYFFCASTTLK